MYINQYLDSYIAPLFHCFKTIIILIQCNHNNIDQEYEFYKFLKFANLYKI